MMNKMLLPALFFCIGAAHAQGFKGTTVLTSRHAGVDHTLRLSHWHTDARGVPAFDYVYEQRAGACQFSLAGHAEAEFEEVRGKVELNVFNPQDEKGRQMPPIVAYDSDDVTFSLPYKGALRTVGLRSLMPPAMRARACDKGDDDGLTLQFSK
jgi:hypothetical protein